MSETITPAEARDFRTVPMSFISRVATVETRLMREGGYDLREAHETALALVAEFDAADLAAETAIANKS